MQRQLQRCRQHLGHTGQHTGVEALHVGGAPAIGPAAFNPQRERIGGPLLVVDRHDVGMAREDIARHVDGADRRQKIGLLSLRIGEPPHRHALLLEIVLNIVDEGEVRVPAHRVEAHEGTEHVEGAGRWHGDPIVGGCPVST